jgi:alpha-glucosidase (family GH31 glycosyl hydrolase)
VLFEDNEYMRVRITDASKPRWEVPNSIVERPSVTSKATNLAYSFTYTENPFSFEVKRNADSAIIFKFSESFIYKDQYIQFTSVINANSKTYGLGESARLNHALKDGSVFTMWARDEPAVVKNVNLYGSFPYYLQMLNGKAHGAMLFTSNGLDVEYHTESITFKSIGGIVDLYVFSGSTPAKVSAQYTSVVGRPAMMPYWSFGFHNCKYGYTSVYEVESIVQNYVNAKIPLDTQWMDIDYMQDYKDFTTDSKTFPATEMKNFVNDLHANGMKFIPIIDPGIMVQSGYDAYDKGSIVTIYI